METTHLDSEVLFPDAIITSRRREAIGHDDVGQIVDRRFGWGTTVLLVVFTLAALSFASLIAVGAVVIATVLFIVGCVGRVVLAISQRVHR